MLFHENGHFNRTLVCEFCFFVIKAMDVVIKNYPSVESRCHLIYHGVNLEKFPMIKPLKFKDRINISAGRLTATKGFNRLVKFVQFVKRGLNVYLTIIGVGGLKNQLEEVAKKNNFRII